MYVRADTCTYSMSVAEDQHDAANSVFTNVFEPVVAPNSIQLTSFYEPNTYGVVNNKQLSNRSAAANQSTGATGTAVPGSGQQQANMTSVVQTRRMSFILTTSMLVVSLLFCTVVHIISAAVSSDQGKSLYAFHIIWMYVSNQQMLSVSWNRVAVAGGVAIQICISLALVFLPTATYRDTGIFSGTVFVIIFYQVFILYIVQLKLVLIGIWLIAVLACAVQVPAGDDATDGLLRFVSYMLLLSSVYPSMFQTVIELTVATTRTVSTVSSRFSLFNPSRFPVK